MKITKPKFLWLGIVALPVAAALLILLFAKASDTLTIKLIDHGTRARLTNVTVHIEQVYNVPIASQFPSLPSPFAFGTPVKDWLPAKEYLSCGEFRSVVH